MEWWEKQNRRWVIKKIGENKYEAYLKALMASNFNVNKEGIIIVSIGSNEYENGVRYCLFEGEFMI